MELLIAIFLGLAASEVSNNREDESETEERTKTTSGYDPYKNVYWTLEQKWTYKGD